MTNIHKIKSMYYNDTHAISKYDISITDSLGNDFIMFFGGNLDLYWLSQNHQPTYVINKTDINLYRIFNSLYMKLKEVEKTKESKLFCESSQLFDGNQFFWYSEDAPIEEANKLTITPDEDSYVINFENNNSQYSPRRTSIRFTNSGSRNHLVVNEFMKLRNYLLETTPDNTACEITDSPSML